MHFMDIVYIQFMVVVIIMYIFALFIIISVGPTGVHTQVYMALKVFECVLKVLHGFRTVFRHPRYHDSIPRRTLVILRKF